MISFLTRLWNFLFGWLGLQIGELEAANPEVVYTNHLRTMRTKYRAATEAAAQVKAIHMRLVKQDTTCDANRVEAKQLLEVALTANDDQSATELLEQIDLLEAENTQVEAEIEATREQLDEILTTLGQVSGEIAKLEKEKSSMIAQMKSAEAQLEVQAAFDGLSPAVEVESLNKVREAIQAKKAQAQINRDIKGSSSEGRMAKLREQAKKSSAADKLAALKAERATKSA